MGDMNAKVVGYCPGDGQTVGKHGIGIRNDNGTRFVDCCQRYGLVIGGTIFPHKTVHKGTWRSPNGITVNQIDHIAISEKHRKHLLDVRALRGADNGLTDHYLVGAKMRVKMVKAGNPQAARRYDIRKLLETEVREEFKATAEEKCQSLECNDVQISWSQW